MNSLQDDNFLLAIGSEILDKANIETICAISAVVMHQKIPTIQSEPVDFEWKTKFIMKFQSIVDEFYNKLAKCFQVVLNSFPQEEQARITTSLSENGTCPSEIDSTKAKLLEMLWMPKSMVELFVSTLQIPELQQTGNGIDWDITISLLVRSPEVREFVKQISEIRKLALNIH